MEIVQLIVNTMNGQNGHLVQFRVEEELKLEAEISKPTKMKTPYQNHVMETGLKKLNATPSFVLQVKY